MLKLIPFYTKMRILPEFFKFHVYSSIKMNTYYEGCMKKKTIVLFLFVLHLMGCKDDPYEGHVRLNKPEFTLRSTDNSNSIKLNNGAIIQAKLTEPGWISDASIEITYKGQAIHIEIPKVAFENLERRFVEKETKGDPIFYYTQNIAQQNSSMIGYRKTQTLATYEDVRNRSCELPGDCGSFQCFGYDSNGICTMNMWISATCYGTQNANFKITPIVTDFILEFENYGNIEAIITFREKTLEDLKFLDAVESCH